MSLIFRWHTQIWGKNRNEAKYDFDRGETSTNRDFQNELNYLISSLKQCELDLENAVNNAHVEVKQEDVTDNQEDPDDTPWMCTEL